MKKTYINPQMECIKVAAPNLLNVSGDGVSVGISNTGASGAAEGRGSDEDW